VKYTHDLVLLAKEETVLQGMIDRLIEIRRCYEMEIDVDKTKVMRISREPSPVEITMNRKQLKNTEYFNYLSSMTTNNARCTRHTRQVESRIAMAEAALNRKKILFTSKLDLNFR
jgi:hypothetical protein